MSKVVRRSGMAAAEIPENAGLDRPAGRTGARAADSSAFCMAKLRAAGLRVTLPRLHILEFLTSEPNQWMCLEEVHQALVKRGDLVTVAAVYKAINEMESRGIVLREFRNGTNGAKAVFVMNPKIIRNATERAVFAVCRQCSSSRLIDDPRVRDQLEAATRKLGLVAAKDHLTLYITCEKCAG